MAGTPRVTGEKAMTDRTANLGRAHAVRAKTDL